MDYQPAQIIASEIVNYPDILLSKGLLGWPPCWIFDGSRELIKGNNPYFSAEPLGPNRRLGYYVKKTRANEDYSLFLEKTETPRSWFSYSIQARYNGHLRACTCSRGTIDQKYPLENTDFGSMETYS
jgi:hypothetical protein